MADIVVAAPGPLETRTGGYRYDARVLAELRGRKRDAQYLALPEDFPDPSPASVEAALESLAAVERNAMLVVDGLAFGTLPAERVVALGRPVVALVHHPLAMETGLSPELADRLEASERAALGAAALVIASGSVTRALLADRYGVPTEKLRVAEPGVDPAPRAKGSGGETPVILTVGTITPRKNQVALARALALLMDLPWRWRVAGALDRDPAYAAELRAAIEEAGIADRVEILGEVDDEALAAAYDGADLFALTSWFEGYGMVYAEALARALPVVAGRTEAAAALVPETAGALVDPADPQAIAAGLRPLIGDPAALRRAGRYARSAGARLPRWFQCADVFDYLIDRTRA